MNGNAFLKHTEAVVEQNEKSLSILAADFIIKC